MAAYLNSGLLLPESLLPAIPMPVFRLLTILWKVPPAYRKIRLRALRSPTILRTVPPAYRKIRLRALRPSTILRTAAHP